MGGGGITCERRVLGEVGAKLLPPPGGPWEVRVLGEVGGVGAKFAALAEPGRERSPAAR